MSGINSVVRAGVQDYLDGIYQWRIWYILGSIDLRRRYVRSRLGQFWFTLSMGLSIAILSFVWALLWRQPVMEMLPHLAAGLIFWQFMQGLISEGAALFATNKHLLLGQRLAASTLVFAMVYKHVLILAHNLVVLVVIFVLARQTLSWNILLAIPALMIAGVSAVWTGYVAAILCARYRDLEQVVGSVLQLAFYLTPVIWKPEFLPDWARWILYVNPFAIYLAVLRDGFMAEPAGLLNWLLAFMIAAVGFLGSLVLVGAYHRRLMFWI